MKDMDIYNGAPVCAADRGPSDFELIQEIIKEDRLGPSLPRPPPPPSELRCQQSHRMLPRTSPSTSSSASASSSSSSSSSQPVLVARGTAHQPSCSFQQLPGPSRKMAHPSRAGRGAPCAASSAKPSSTELLERFLERPKLVVVEEPKERGMRFRYECEGRSAGSILGASGTENNKTQPAIEIQGPIDRVKKATVTVSLVTKDPPHRPHPHCLVGKDCPNGSGICVVTMNPHSNRRHSFSNLGIQCVRRKELDISLQKRRNQNIDPFQTGHSKGIEDMDMNSVRLCFQCELEWEDGRKDCLSPVVSNPIYDKKATTTSQLKISQLNQYRGSCAGKTEIYMLCDKVQKDDIEIIFRRDSWKANGEFAQTDVHRQIAIVFKTPPYQDADITEEVEVSVSLRRLSDQMESEPVTFTYLPYNPDPYEVKRKRKLDLSFRDKPRVAASESVPAAAAPTLHFPAAPTLSPDERLCLPQPGNAAAAATVEMCCDAQQDFAMSGEDMSSEDILNQIFDLPSFQEMLSDSNLNLGQGFEAVVAAAAAASAPDPAAAAAIYANMDAGLGQNFDSYSYAQYNDLQFNRLVNESQGLQAETQDGGGGGVQVKTENQL